MAYAIVINSCFGKFSGSLQIIFFLSLPSITDHVVIKPTLFRKYDKFEEYVGKYWNTCIISEKKWRQKLHERDVFASSWDCNGKQDK